MTETPQRKAEHIDIVVNENVDFDISNGLDDVKLIHHAVPELSLEEISTDVCVLGKHLAAPIMIAAMTGGHPAAYRVNSSLSEVAEAFKIGFSLGSQRAALEDSRFEYTYRIAREKAPTALIFGNIGVPQLLDDPVGKAMRAIEMVNADALAIHLNPLQEALQLEGETNYSKALQSIEEVARGVQTPTIIKETGSGLSREVVRKLARTGISGLDVGGAGGTSWAAVEYYRAKRAGDPLRSKVCKTFWNWGLPTAVAICESRCEVGEDMLIIASGGIRNGLQIAKALALGANLVGIAAPFLRILVHEGIESVINYIKQLVFELKVAMFLVGARNVNELRHKPVILTGLLKDWALARNLFRKNYLLPSLKQLGEAYE